MTCAPCALQGFGIRGFTRCKLFWFKAGGPVKKTDGENGTFCDPQTQLRAENDKIINDADDFLEDEFSQEVI